jgi:hypothetical protein
MHQVVASASFRAAWELSQSAPTPLNLNSLDRPRMWAISGLLLRRNGFRGSPHELSNSEPALLKLQDSTNIRGERVPLFGIPFGTVVFSASVGCFLGLISFALIGPLLALRDACPRSIGHPWVFAVRTSGRRFGNILEAMLLLTSFAWATIPLVLLAMQLSAGLRLSRWEYVAMLIGALGLAFSTVVNFIVGNDLRKLRRHKMPHGP